MEWKEYKCLRCGHKWFPRTPLKKPRLCPSCKSKYWEEDREDGKRRNRK